MCAINFARNAHFCVGVVAYVAISWTYCRRYDMTQQGGEPLACERLLGPPMETYYVFLRAKSIIARRGRPVVIHPALKRDLRRVFHYRFFAVSRSMLFIGYRRSLNTGIFGKRKSQTVHTSQHVLQTAM